jgi:tetratricopeptide (TPR) repeat protein
MNPLQTMKKLFIILILIGGVVSCEKDTEFPLSLPAAAEPSAKMYNDRGIDHYRTGDYKEAVIAFVQARTADHTAGEIHFNLALTRLKLDDKDKARQSFKLAIKHSYGNPKILKSPLLNETLGAAKK